MSGDERRIVWNKAAEKDFRSFPDEVRSSFRKALEEARQGKHPSIAAPYGQPLGKGYFKLKDDEQGSTYRGIYCVRYKEAIYVLHAFQKKSKSGKADPSEEVNTAKVRAKWAEMEHGLWELDHGTPQKGNVSRMRGGKR